MRWSLWSVELWRRGVLPSVELGDPLWEAAKALRGVRGLPQRVAAAERSVDALTRNAHLVMLASWCARWELSRAEPNPFHSALALHGAGCWLRGFTVDGVARLALPSLAP